MRRETPGPLSSIDMVPEEGRNDIQWALDELNKRERTQADILFDLNDRLAAHGLAPISRSAFNRRAIREYTMKRRTEDGRAIYAALAPNLTPDKIGEGDLVLGELIKTLILELLDAGSGAINTAGAMELAQAYVKTIQGQRMSAELRKQAEKEFADKASAAIDKVAKARGLSAETAKDIRAQILGVKE
jgi:hypothetical protein